MVKYAIYELQKFGFGDVAKVLQAGFADWNKSAFCLDKEPFMVSVVPSVFALSYEYPCCLGFLLNHSNACLNGKGAFYDNFQYLQLESKFEIFNYGGNFFLSLRCRVSKSFIKLRSGMPAGPIALLTQLRFFFCLCFYC
jgi:hypothetical protein